MIYFIDYENVSNSGLKGVEQLTKSDKIIIFYSKNQTNISMQTHRRLELSEVEKEYIEVNTSSKNALDFQLATYLGALIKEMPQENFAIVSKDKGYNAVVEFWKKHKITIAIYTSTSNTELKDLKDELEIALTNHKDKIANITTIINKYKTKQAINNALVKEYKSEIAGSIYKAIKPLLKDKT